jgi:Ca2+-binding RTX toxin-like protein
MAITAATRQDIIELVVTAYNAAPGTELLSELVAIVDGGGTLADVAANLTTRDEWTSRYPSFQTAEEFAAEWLGNLVPEASAEALAEGISVAVGLVNGGASFADIMIEAQSFLSALSEDDASFGSSAANFNNKVEVATYYTITLEESAQSTDTISAVTSDDDSVTTAKSNADTASTPAVAGETYSLVTGLDNKVLGAGDDGAFATDATTAASDTFNPSDLVNGGAGDDTFYLTLTETTGAVSYTPSRITNFETLSLTNVDAEGALTVDVSLMGIENVQNSASTQAVTVSNATAGTTLSAMGNTAATTLTVKGAGLTGAEDTATISLTSNTGAVTYQSSTAQDIEKATVDVSGVNTSALTIEDSSNNAATTHVTVTGAGSWDMETGGNIASALATLDASANTGGVTFDASLAAGTTLMGGSGNDDLQGAAGNDVITGGAGDDTLAMGSGGIDHVDGGAGNDTVTLSGFTKDDTVSGGDGVDTLVTDTAIAYDDEAEPTPIDAGVNISGFEVLKNSGAITQDMAALDGIVALQSSSGVLTATEASGITDYYALADSTGLDITLATDGTADSLNIHMGVDSAQSNAQSVTVDAVEIETALIASKGLDGNILSDFQADSLTSLTIIGSKNLTVTLNDSAAVSTIPLTTVDASAFTGDTLSITAVEADSGVTVTTGSEALTVTVGDGANDITGTAGDDEVTTGSGADVISTGDGEDDIDAGDGANTITVGDGNATIDGGEGVDTITAGDGDTDITLGDGADVLVLGDGDNVITNEGGNATITVGDGENTVTNDAGDSTITLGDGGNTVNLTAGNSTVVTGDLADDINITAGNNDITSGGGNDTISLGSGNDTVDAGAGTDTVDFSVSSGTWTGSITNAETVSASFTGSAKIDATGISGYTTLSVAAADDTVTTTLNNLGSSTVSLTDDAAEGSGTGDLEAVTIDTTDDAEITVSLGANQNAATAVASVLGSLTITDADAVTLKSSGGGFGNLIENDFEGVALDDDETTSLTVEAGSDYTSLATANITGTEGLASLSIDATGAESDIEVDTIADATNLQTLTINASGLNSQVELGIVGNEASTTDAILSSLTVTASNGADIDFAGTTDAELGDINTGEDMDSITISASGAGSTITAGEISADGLEVTTVELEASAGGSIDAETVSDALTLNYGYESLILQATGVDSAIVADELTQDAGSLATTAESTITIEADDYASITTGEATLGGVDLDTVHIGIGNGASIVGDETDITATGDIGNLDIDFDANSTHTGAFDINTGKILGTLSINIGDEASFGTGALVLELTDDVDAEIGIKTLNVDIADQDGSAIVVDLEATSVITVNSNSLIDIEDDGEDGSTYYNGEVTLRGDDDNTVLIGASALLDTALPTAGTDSVYGSWDIDTGDGADTITGSPGADTIDSTGGADSVLGGGGNDTLTVGNGADTVGGGAGNDTINLTESVSAADVVEFSSDVEVAAEANTSDSTFDEAESGVIDRGQDTITGFTAGTDTIAITVVGLNEFVHGTDTAIGLGTATTAGTGAANFGTTVGLINLDNAETGEGTFEAGGDVIVNFSSPTTTMTKALFEAALSYTVTGTGTGVDTITTGGLADTYNVTAGNDVVDLGAGDDTIATTNTLLEANNGTTATHDGGAGDDTLSVTGAATLVDADFRGLSNIETLKLNTGDNTLTAGDAFQGLIETIDITGAIDLVLTQDTGDTLGTASAPLEIVGLTVNSEATKFDFLGTDAASDADLSASGFGAVPVDGLFVDADGTAASFFTAAAAGFDAGDIGIFVTGGNTYVFAEGAATAATDDVHLVITGVSLTAISATHNTTVLHI